MSLRLPSSLPCLLHHHHRLPRYHRLVSASNPTTTAVASPPPSTEPSTPPSPPPTPGRWRWRGALGQRLNAAGVLWFATVASREPHLALPHVAVPDIRRVDWDALARLGFRGVVFDKDNTLTAPYSLSVWPPIAGALDRCRAAFPGRIAIFSNSAGLYEYDPDGSHARAVEEAIEGVHVVRHATKKPSGSSEEIERYFDCAGSHLIMVGDRYFTDVVYGNRNGFLTILTEPLSISEEPFIVQQVRKLENYLVSSWHQRGIKPTKHALLEDPQDCMIPPSL